MVEDIRIRALLQRLIRIQVVGCETGRGLPIGYLTSQHFANFYLGALDHYLQENFDINGYIRYMVDEMMSVQGPAFGVIGRDHGLRACAGGLASLRTKMNAHLEQGLTLPKVGYWPYLRNIIG